MPNTHLSTHFRSRGFSLIEIMVALTISLLLLGGVYTIYISSKSSYKTQEGLSRIQESARFAVDMLTQDLRPAGLVGCDSRSNNIEVNNIAKIPSGTSADILQFNGGKDGIEGFEQDSIDSAGLAKLGLTSGEIIAGTDIVQVKTLASADCQVAAKDNGATPFTANLKVLGTCEIQQDEIVLVSDCKDADLFAVSNNPQGNTDQDGNRTVAHANNVNTHNKLSTVYGPDAEVLHFQNIIYFIGTGASGEPALMRRRLNGSNLVSEEIVDGVENMQVQYGIDTDNDAVANRYVDADDALIGGDFSRVMSIRVALLLRSTSTAGNVYGDPTSGDVAQAAQPFLDIPFFLTDTQTSEPVSADFTTPNDRRLRRVFISTIKLRNRLF